MATWNDLTQFIWGQAFGSTSIPKGTDFSGKTVIVTGANSGLGLECAKHLARLRTERLILGCRNVEKGNAAKEAILKQTSSTTTTIEIWELDLASHQSVLKFGERVRTSLPRLDAFIANAGVELMNFTLAEDLETTLTVNVISTMLLNIAVLPKLRDTSKKHGTTYLTAVGSMVHIFASPSDLVPSQDGIDTFAKLSDPKTADMGSSEASMGPRYALSKTLLHAAMLHFASCASRPDHQEDVVVNWLNPGWCASELSRHKPALSGVPKIMFSMIGRTAEQGSRTLVHAVVAGKETNGRYLSECRVKPESDFLRSNEGIQTRERLWKELMVRIEKISPETAAIIE